MFRRFCGVGNYDVDRRLNREGHEFHSCRLKPHYGFSRRAQLCLNVLEAFDVGLMSPIKHMNSMQRVCIFLIAVDVFSLCQAEDASQKDALTVKLNNSMGMEEHRARMADMRQFLWTHWIKQSEAKLIFTDVSKEGVTTQPEYAIVTPAGGVLMLRAAFAREEHWISGHKIPKSDGGYEAYTIERILSKNPRGIGKESNITRLSPDAVTPPTDYWLLIKGSDGKIITYF